MAEISFLEGLLSVSRDNASRLGYIYPKTNYDRQPLCAPPRPPVPGEPFLFTNTNGGFRPRLAGWMQTYRYAYLAASHPV